MNKQEEYLMIDKTIDLDIASLPKLLQNTIKDMEEYEKKGEWIMYDGLAEGLESFAKSALLENKISNNNILEYGTEVHFIDFFKFVERCKKENEEIENKHVKEGGEDILLIGLKLNQDLKNKIIKL